MQRYILTFDVGTSSCKAALFSEDGALLAVTSAGYDFSRLPDGCVEQNPSDILNGVREALALLREQGYALKHVLAIGFSSQMAAHCLVDEDNHAITPIISWMDQRSAPQVELYNANFTPDDTLRLTGMDMLITPAHTISKLKWFRDCAPELLAKAKHVVQVKELIIHMLTGEWVSDPTSLKGVVHAQSGRPIREILDFCGVQESILPRVAQPYEMAGRLRAGVEGFEDLEIGTPVVIGWNDMNAACLGMCGLPQQQIGFDLTGTSEHLGIIMNNAPQTFQCSGVNRVPFLEKREICYGVTSSGGQAFDWFVKNIFAHGNVQSAYNDLLKYVSHVKRSEMKELVFLPYLEGERNPWHISEGSGVFVGLNGKHDKYHMAYAVMEGVCFALRTIYERMPMKTERLILAGGAARNDVWNQMKADSLNCVCERLHTTEAGCNGAAILAMACLQGKSNLLDIARHMTATVQSWIPDPLSEDYYNEKYRRFLRLNNWLRNEYERS